jgi:hypothetical protein
MPGKDIARLNRQGATDAIQGIEIDPRCSAPGKRMSGVIGHARALRQRLDGQSLVGSQFPNP